MERVYEGRGRVFWVERIEGGEVWVMKGEDFLRKVGEKGGVGEI